MNREEPLEPHRLPPLNREPLRAARPRATLLCLSHLRWGFVYQRPQHLMSRLARDYDVLFFEEPIFEGHAAPRLESHAAAPGVTLLVPQLPAGMRETQAIRAQRELLDAYLAEQQAAELLLWYFTPMSLAFTGHLRGQVVIFDCMDELSAFRHAPPALVDMERRLMTRADVVFTGGHSLWEAKRRHHANIHAMPSSVDVAHFAAARQPLPAGRRSAAAQWRALAEWPFIHLARHSSVRQYLEAAFHPHAMRTLMEVEQLATVMGMVRAGLGISVVPTLTLFHFQQEGLATRPLALPGLTRQIYLVRRRDRGLSVAAQALYARVMQQRPMHAEMPSKQ